MTRQWTILWYACAILCITGTYVESLVLRPRIIGGTDAAEGEVPFYSAWSDNPQQNLQCGGSLISEEWFLTAGMCTRDRSQVNRDEKSNQTVSAERDSDSFSRILLTPDGVVNTTGFVLHKDFNVTGQLENDIALVRLERKVKLPNNGQFAKIYSGEVHVNDMLRMAGMGGTYKGSKERSSTLKTFPITIAEPAHCRKFTSIYDDANGSRMCAAIIDERGACDGDTGGPLYKEVTDSSPVLVGITSITGGFGPDNCAPKDGAVYFTHASHYLDWISQTTGIPKDQLVDNSQEN
ncbi:hypothetical protein IWQ62_000415 [Dispira parvispora]|uniref:Peptidase S1 domain-containing protein n=1 Tax=Dispira parvispora TaxID=1520584 RepID=A0A9W8E990_9FUNG|nr:hypothetical protein IWQ62_000415 [Dispira parvispora]